MAELIPNHICQKLLESDINLQHILDKARSLDAPQKNSEEFSIAHTDFIPDDNAAAIHRLSVETIDQRNLASNKKNLNAELNVTDKVKKVIFVKRRFISINNARQ